MTNIEYEWNKLAQLLENIQGPITQAVGLLPTYGEGNKLRSVIQKRWSSLVDVAAKLENLICDDIEPMEITLPWDDAEFTKSWQFYKDYLVEQHKMTLKSRMECARLKLLQDYCNNDPKEAIKLLEYYVAFGSPGIYKLNPQETPIKNDQANTTTTIKFI